MLTEELRKKLIQNLKKEPKEVIKLIEKEPQILEILLNSDEQAEKERREKIKYINMTSHMQNQLQEKAKQLKTTQGILIGGAILLLLSLLDK